MRFSSRARYALRMMLDIGHYAQEGRPISLTTVAEHTGLSRGYLEQVAAPLRAAELIRAVPGRSGGYQLARPPQQITLGQIIEAAIGPIYLVDCLEEPGSCLRTPSCECRVVYALINMRITEVLHGYTLSDLLDPRWVRSVGPEISRLTGIALSDGPDGPGAGGAWQGFTPCQGNPLRPAVMPHADDVVAPGGEDEAQDDAPSPRPPTSR